MEIQVAGQSFSNRPPRCIALHCRLLHGHRDQAAEGPAGVYRRLLREPPGHAEAAVEVRQRDEPGRERGRRSRSRKRSWTRRRRVRRLLKARPVPARRALLRRGEVPREGRRQGQVHVGQDEPAAADGEGGRNAGDQPKDAQVNNSVLN